MISQEAPHHTSAHDVFCFAFEGNPYQNQQRFISVPELRTKVGDKTNDPIVQELNDGTERAVPEHERIDLGQPCRFGRSPRFKRGDGSRLEQDLERLRKELPNMRYAAALVEVPDFSLPAGLYGVDRAWLAFPIPPEYPINPPDNFYVAAGLRFRDGRMLTNYTEQVVGSYGTLGVFSFHIEGWRSGGPDPHDLRSFVRAVAVRLQEGQ